MGTGLRRLLAVGFSLGALAAAALWGPSPAADGPNPALPVLRDPRWWKGNLHTHSFWSDGDDFPEMIADWYKRNGYAFLGLSDHNILSDGDKWIDQGPDEGPRQEALQKYLARFGGSWVERREVQEKGVAKAQVRLKPLREFRSVLEEPGKYLLIPAEEITHKFAKAPVDINAVNLRDLVTPTDGDNVSETIRANLRLVAEQRKKTGWPTIAFLNHPNFGWGVRAEDLFLLDGLGFFEIYNGHPGVRNYGDEQHAGVERVWDIVLAQRLGKLRLPVVWGLATDDAHSYHTFAVGKSNPGRGWIMVRAPHLTAEAVIRAMEAGDFYSSSGVVLDDVARQGDEFQLVIRPEKGVTYKTQFIATLRDASLDSKAVLDADGKPLDVTRTYSPDVGKVIAESTDLQPRYRLTGKELYVRAKVISSKPHPNPFQKGDVEAAWTQPVVK